MNFHLDNYPDLSFSAWLLRQDTRNDAVGHLARSLRHYRQYDFWYSVPETLDGCHMYLAKAEMDIEAHEALVKAWKEWCDLHPDEEVSNG